MSVCACGAGFEPPPHRPDWAKCYACTTSPAHARRGRMMVGVGSPLTHPTWANEDAVTFTVPGPPLSVNRMYQLARYGQKRRMHYSPEGAAFKSSIQSHAVQAFTKIGIGTWDQTRRFHVSLHSYFDNARADDDNPVKIVRDALQGILYTNDVQVVSTHSEKTVVPKGQARLVVTVEAVP